MGKPIVYIFCSIYLVGLFHLASKKMFRVTINVERVGFFFRGMMMVSTKHQFQNTHSFNEVSNMSNRGGMLRPFYVFCHIRDRQTSRLRNKFIMWTKVTNTPYNVRMDN